MGFDFNFSDKRDEPTAKKSKSSDKNENLPEVRQIIFNSNEKTDSSDPLNHKKVAFFADEDTNQDPIFYYLNDSTETGFSDLEPNKYEGGRCRLGV